MNKRLLASILLLLSTSSFAISQCYEEALADYISQGYDKLYARLMAEKDCASGYRECFNERFYFYMNRGTGLDSARSQASHECYVPSTYDMVYQNQLNLMMNKGYGLDQARGLARERAVEIIYGPLKGDKGKVKDQK